MSRGYPTHEIYGSIQSINSVNVSFLSFFFSFSLSFSFFHGSKSVCKERSWINKPRIHRGLPFCLCFFNVYILHS